MTLNLNNIESAANTAATAPASPRRDKKETLAVDFSKAPKAASAKDEPVKLVFSQEFNGYQLGLNMFMTKAYKNKAGKDVPSRPGCNVRLTVTERGLSMAYSTLKKTLTPEYQKAGLAYVAKIEGTIDGLMKKANAGKTTVADLEILREFLRHRNAEGDAAMVKQITDALGYERTEGNTSDD